MTAASPFLRNAWYMAGWSAEVGETLLSRRILGEPVLLFRKQNGSVAALTDRCPVTEDGTTLHSDWWMPDLAAPPHTFGIYDPGMRCDHWLEMRWDPPGRFNVPPDRSMPERNGSSGWSDSPPGALPDARERDDDALFLGHHPHRAAFGAR